MKLEIFGTNQEFNEDINVFSATPLGDYIKTGIEEGIAKVPEHAAALAEIVENGAKDIAQMVKNDLKNKLEELLGDFVDLPFVQDAVKFTVDAGNAIADFASGPVANTFNDWTNKISSFTSSVVNDVDNLFTGSLSRARYYSGTTFRLMTPTASGHTGYGKFCNNNVIKALDYSTVESAWRTKVTHMAENIGMEHFFRVECFLTDNCRSFIFKTTTGRGYLCSSAYDVNQIAHRANSNWLTGLSGWQSRKFDSYCGKVEIFGGGWYDGWKVLAYNGNFDVNDLFAIGGENDQMSSIKVPSGCQVTLWDSGTYSGNNVQLGPGNYDYNYIKGTALGNDKMSSFKVENYGG